MLEGGEQLTGPPEEGVLHCREELGRRRIGAAVMADFEDVGAQIGPAVREQPGFGF